MYDVIIIGAGSAGLTAASIFRKAGSKYLLVHHGFKGTTCADRGCMPSKALIQVADSYAERLKFDDFGVDGAQHLNVDMKRVMDHVRALRDRFTGSVIDGMDKYNTIFGQSRFIDRNTIEVDGKHYSANNFIIATGSLPRIPDALSEYRNDILTTDNFFEQKDFGGHIALIGLGAVGIELGQALSRLGVKVSAINKRRMISGIKDKDVLDTAIDIFGRDMDLIFEEDVQSVQKNGNGYQLKLSDQSLECDQIMVAAGRTPNLKNLNLKHIGVEHDDEGNPKIDIETLKIKGFPIYLAGDVNGYKTLLHEAHDESNVIAADILDKEKPARRTPLSITFTNPNIAQIGLQPDDIKQDYVTGTVSYDNQGRARVMSELHGMVKIYATHKERTILGAELIAPAGEHMAHLLALAVQQKLTVSQVLELPFYHPTLEEGVRTALRSIHDPDRDCLTDRLC